MDGINSYEELLRHPEKEIIDFAYLNTHPEAKQAVWLRYEMDVNFKWKLNQIMSVNPYFKVRFKECFSSYLPKAKGR